MFDVGGGRGIARASAMTETGGGPPIAAENTYVLLQLVGNDAAGLYCARTVGKSVTLEEAQEPDNNRVRVHLKARVHDFDEGKVNSAGYVTTQLRDGLCLPRSDPQTPSAMDS